MQSQLVDRKPNLFHGQVYKIQSFPVFQVDMIMVMDAGENWVSISNGNSSVTISITTWNTIPKEYIGLIWDSVHNIVTTSPTRLKQLQEIMKFSQRFPYEVEL